MGQDFTVINDITKWGLLDLLFKLHKIDIIYFNWIEDIPDRKYGILQVNFLKLLLLLAKKGNVKIIWFLHNNISHNSKNLIQKKVVIKLMQRFSDIILSHSNEVKVDIAKKKFYFFHHPLDFYKPAETALEYEYDLLIWGTVSNYKGIREFVEFASTNVFFKTLKIKIAGKFKCNELFEEIKSNKSSNIILLNKLLPEDELINLFSVSNYILFTYNSESVLSSAALCKSLSYGKQVICPYLGAFKELGNEGLVFNYNSFDNLEALLKDLNSGKRKKVDSHSIEKYYQATNWNSFTQFLKIKISDLYPKVA